MKARVSISVKVLLLAFLNILLLGLVLGIFVRVQYRFDLSSLLLAPGRDRILSMSRLIALQLPYTEREGWTQLLTRYGSGIRASCYLYDDQGTQLAGPHLSLPPDVVDAMRRHRGSPFGPGGPREPAPDQLEHPGHMPLPLPPPVFLTKTESPRRYWVTVPVPINSEGKIRPVFGMLVWEFSSFWTNPVLFDYEPWLAVAVAVVLVSVACWLPLIRGLTRSIFKLRSATGAIAEGQLETRLPVNRRDELGQLSESINHMADSLSKFVNGQKRFLGDIAHELCSPIARIQAALAILEQRAQADQKEYVADVQEDVRNMSSLVSELLLFSKAGMAASATPLTCVNVAETVDRVVRTEAANAATIETHVDKAIEVMAHPDLLFRALANVLRNAIRYAGDAGPIVIWVNVTGKSVSITISDNGPGLPSSELEQVFRPFYRPEFARRRETGGVGLGLAIARNCIQACGGTVTCRNRSPRGLVVEIKLQVAQA
jgi:two-component system sensor histidine kinase CpxA